MSSKLAWICLGGLLAFWALQIIWFLWQVFVEICLPAIRVRIFGGGKNGHKTNKDIC